MKIFESPLECLGATYVVSLIGLLEPVLLITIELFRQVLQLRKSSRALFTYMKFWAKLTPPFQKRRLSIDIPS